MKKWIVKLTVVGSMGFLLLTLGMGYLTSASSVISMKPEEIQLDIPESPPSELHVLSYNVFLRPTTLSLSNHPQDRAELIGQWLKTADVDVVALQEAWEADAISLIINEVSQELPYYVTSPPTERLMQPISAGLLIFSRWPIEKTRVLVYNSCHFEDCQASKGALHVVIRLAENSYLNFVTTHLDAGGFRADRNARAAQVKQLRQFIAEIDQDIGPIIVTGDFNVDSLSEDVTYNEYNMLIETLGVADYVIPDISTLNCNIRSSVYCEEPVIPTRIDYVFTMLEEQRLARRETLHLSLATDSIDDCVKYLSDHRAVWVTFETNFP